MSEKPINLFEPSFHIDDTLALIRECLEKGWTGAGYKTLEFEQAWREYTGLPHAHFLNSATSGLELAVQLLRDANGWQQGDQIITTPLTFVSTNHAILRAGLRPVFADVDEYLCLDPESVLERITPKTRAVMFVGLGGNVGRYPEIAEICREKGLKIILDAAHMAGSRWLGRHVGYDADATVFSFHAVKNLPTADSGMVCFADETLDREARKWSWLGISKDTYARTQEGGGYAWYYDVEHVGYKMNGNSIMASIALAGLPYLDIENELRREAAIIYTFKLSHFPQIAPVPHRNELETSRHLYQVLIPNRDWVITELHKRQIYPGVHYRINTDYRMYAYAKGTCPNAEKASKELLSLPLHLKLEYFDIRRVIDALGEIVHESSRQTIA